MSLINKMLQDLESRKNPQPGKSPTTSVFEDLKSVKVSPARASSRRLRWVLLAIVVMGAGAYGWMQWGDSLYPGNTAAVKSRSAAPRILPPQPAPALAAQAPPAPAPMLVANTSPAPAAVPAENKLNQTPAGNAPAQPVKEPTKREAAPATPKTAPASAGKSAAAVDAGYWIVSRGDTLYGISSKTGVDLSDLSKWNHLGRARIIYPGQRLRLVPSVPSAAKAGAAPPAEKQAEAKKPEKQKKNVTVATAEKPRMTDVASKAAPPPRVSDESSPARGARSACCNKSPADGAAMDKKVRPFTADEKAESEFRQAVTLLQKGRAMDAEKHLEATIKINAEHTKARELLAGLLLQNGHWREAEQTLEQGIAKVPAYSPFAQLLARIYVDHGSNQKALAVMESSRRAGAGDAEFMAFLAEIYRRTGDHAAAIKAYTEAIKLDPQEGRSWLGMGISLEAIQDWNAAGAAYQRAMETGKLDENLLKYARQRLAIVKAK